MTERVTGKGREEGDIKGPPRCFGSEQSSVCVEAELRGTRRRVTPFSTAEETSFIHCGEPFHCAHSDEIILGVLQNN